MLLLSLTLLSCTTNRKKVIAVVPKATSHLFWVSIHAGAMAAGHDPETPAAVIHRGTTPAEEVVTGTLGDIARRAADLPPPATIVIGDVVRLRDCLRGLDAGVGAAQAKQAAGRA